MMTRSFCTLIFALLIAAEVRAEPDASSYLTELRAPHLSDRERAELAVEMAVKYTEQALASPPESRDATWTKAEGVCAVFAESWPANPRRLLVEVQQALVSLARGQQLRDETAGTAGATAGAAQALEHLRTAVRQLNDSAAAAGRELIELRLRPQADRSPDSLSLTELESLEANVSYQSARAQRQLGLCYPPRSADRDDALLQAVSHLTPLAQQTAPDILVWNARVELAACQRELGRLQPSLDLLDAWSQENPPPEIAARLGAERARIFLAAGRTQQAIDAAAAALQNDTTTSGELALANLEATLAARSAARKAGQPTDASAIVAQIDAIRNRNGPYWARRAQLLVGGALAAGREPSDDAQSLILAAQHLYFNDDVDGALAAYNRAIRRLEQQQQADQAFATTMTAAAIEREAGRPAEAAKRYQQLALRKPNHPRAAEAHRLAILCAADTLRDTPPADQGPLAAFYEQLFDEHLRHWPQSATADEVRLWRGQWLAGRGDFRAAIEVLQRVATSSPHAADAVTLIVNCYDRLLKSFDGGAGDAARRARIDLLAAATRQLQPMITGPDNRWPTTWSNLERDAAAELAALHLRHSEGSSEYAERLLAAALRGPAASLDAERNQKWEATARSRLVAALARNGKPAEAMTVVEQLADGPAEQLLEIVAQITAAAERATTTNDDNQRALGQLALEVIRLLDARLDELDAPAVARLNGYRAAALAAAGDRATSIAQYAELASQSPNDGEVQERLAAMLAASDSPADLQQALVRWQEVEQRSRRGGPRWRRARQARIELLIRLGDQQEADKLLRLTRLLYPDWDSHARP